MPPTGDSWCRPIFPAFGSNRVPEAPGQSAEVHSNQVDFAFGLSGWVLQTTPSGSQGDQGEGLSYTPRLSLTSNYPCSKQDKPAIISRFFPFQAQTQFS